MLVDLSRSIGTYLHDVFVNQLDWWVALGVLAQALFTLRFVVQWLASERAGKSVIPFSFWTLSIGGGAGLLVYAIIRHDPVYILGQSMSLFIYMRNITFVLRERRQTKTAAGGA
jgi:lipid-A-disaccharide synthase-like uncharacterized protein